MSALAIISSFISGRYEKNYQGKTTDTDKLIYLLEDLDRPRLQWIKTNVAVHKLNVNQARILAYMARIHMQNGSGDYYYGGSDGSDRRISKAQYKLLESGLIERKGEYPFTKYVWVG